MTPTPPDPTLYSELKTWQSGIAAMIGFFALIIGALFNFHLNRRRDALLRKEESLSVAIAVYSEILLLRKEIANLASAVANKENSKIKIDAQFVEDNKLTEPTIYPALASKLDLLSANILIGITEFYQNIKDAKLSLPLLVERDRVITKDGKVMPIAFHVEAVLRPAVDAVYEVKPTLRLIEKLAKILPIEDPDVGLADAILEKDFSHTYDFR
jgi:hypothetical protein